MGYLLLTVLDDRDVGVIMNTRDTDNSERYIYRDTAQQDTGSWLLSNPAPDTQAQRGHVWGSGVFS